MIFFLSEEQAVQAVKLGIPVGYVTKQEVHHGSSAGLHTFYILSEQNYSTLSNDESMDKGPVFHYTMTKEQKKKMLDIINVAIKDPSFAKEIEKLKRDDDIGFNMLWYAVFRTVGVFLYESKFCDFFSCDLIIELRMGDTKTKKDRKRRINNYKKISIKNKECKYD